MNNNQRNIHTIDAQGKTLGRLASEIARLLIGKHKPTYAPHLDAGEHVQVVNAGGMVITGKKLEQKVYQHHTTYAGGLREKKMSAVWARDPGEVLRRAVSRMLPKNSFRKKRLQRLVVSK